MPPPVRICSAPTLGSLSHCFGAHAASGGILFLEPDVIKRTLLIFIVACLTAGVGCGDTPSNATSKVHWLTSYEKALALSQKTGKPILADFTGSDWCPPCQALKRKVFQTPDFATWAGEHVILLEVDYPRAKPQDAELKSQNAMLQMKYGAVLKGYPTVLFLDGNGTVLTSIDGYGGTSAQKWIEAADQKLTAAKPLIIDTPPNPSDKRSPSG
jgi:protein disulfide-isomerase